MERYKLEQDREIYKHLRMTEGVEVKTLVSNLEDGDIILMPHLNVAFWTVDRIYGDFNESAIFIYASLNSKIKDILMAKKDDAVTVMKLAHPEPVKPEKRYYVGNLKNW